MEEGDKRTEGGEGGRGRELSSGPRVTRGARGDNPPLLHPINYKTYVPVQLCLDVPRHVCDCIITYIPM